MSSAVVGVYDNIEVKNNSTVAHAGKTNQPITWINQWTFYFEWSPGNEQIWIFDTNKNSLYQICNSINSDTIKTPHARHSPIYGWAPNDQKNLGNFKDISVKENTIDHFGQTKNIVWINPLAFYFIWGPGNEQIWIYDSRVSAYLQLGQWPKSVNEAFTHGKERIHHKLNITGPVVGVYKNIDVKNSTVDHSGRKDQHIEWINLFTFYFEWSPGNEQIWIYDTKKNCLYQITNNQKSDILKNSNARLSPIQGWAPIEKKNLGDFREISVYEETINYYGQIKPIVWINPLAFYFKWAKGNEQIWIYDSKISAYLQLGQWPNSTKNVFVRSSERTYHKL